MIFSIDFISIFLFYLKILIVYIIFKIGWKSICKISIKCCFVLFIKCIYIVFGYYFFFFLKEVCFWRSDSIRCYFGECEYELVVNCKCLKGFIGCYCEISKLLLF